jgi:DNA (cytosine-5)-methyltransferase 1
MSPRSKPRLLDLFCGAGGAAMGYSRAGFEVVGVDIAPQPHYPFEFYQGDALAALDPDDDFYFDVDQFDAIHASPPCQAYTEANNRWRGQDGHADSHPYLIEPVRTLLRSSGLPYVIENVQGAKSAMEVSIVLHGGMFGLHVIRRRLFESNLALLQPLMAEPTDFVAVYGDAPDGRRVSPRKYLLEDGVERVFFRKAAKGLKEAQDAMGMDWADWHGTKEAIPPAYTEFIGRQLLDQL